MRKALVILLASVALLGFARPWSAVAASPDDAKPFGVVVSVASYNELVRNVGRFGRLIGRPETDNLDKMLEAMVTTITLGKGPVGIDTTRPWGVVWPNSGFSQALDSQRLKFYTCVPITDLKQALGLFEPFAAIEEKGGVYEIVSKGNKDGKEPSYVKAVGRWAFSAEKAEWLTHLADPTPWFAELPKQYFVAVRWFVADMPSGLRGKLLANLDQAAQKNRQRRPGETDADRAGRVGVQNFLFQGLKDLLNDLDQVTLGLALDAKGEKPFLDLNLTAREGTPIAAQIALLEKTESRFLKFQLPGAAVVARWAGTLSPQNADKLLSFIHLIRDSVIRDSIVQEPKKKEPAKKESAATRKPSPEPLIRQVVDLLEKGVTSGPCDGTVSVALDPKAVTLLAVTRIADTVLLEKALHTLSDLGITNDPAMAGWAKFNVDHVGPVRLHTLTIPISSNKQLAAMVGDPLSVVIGVGRDAAYVAAGHRAMAAMRRALETADQSAHSATPLELSVAMGSLIRFAEAVSDAKDRPKSAISAAEFGKMPDQEHIRFTLRCVPRGVQYHLEVEPGIVRAFGRMVANAMKAQSQQRP